MKIYEIGILFYEFLFVIDCQINFITFNCENFYL